MPIAAWQRRGTELMIGHRHKSMPMPALAFGFHCSVFKKRFPDQVREPELTQSCRSDTHPPHLATGAEMARAGHAQFWVLVSTSRRSGLFPSGIAGVRGGEQDY